MNTGVEIALIATPVPLLAIARDLWIRARVEHREERDRIDRIDKERLDREQSARMAEQTHDLEIIRAVPAWMALEAVGAERELLQEQKHSGLLKEQNDVLEARIKEVATEELIKRDETLRGFGTTATEMFALMAVPGAMDALRDYCARWQMQNNAP